MSSFIILTSSLKCFSYLRLRGSFSLYNSTQSLWPAFFGTNLTQVCSSQCRIPWWNLSAKLCPTVDHLKHKNFRDKAIRWCQSVKDSQKNLRWSTPVDIYRPHQKVEVEITVRPQPWLKYNDIYAQLIGSQGMWTSSLCTLMIALDGE